MESLQCTLRFRRPVSWKESSIAWHFGIFWVLWNGVSLSLLLTSSLSWVFEMSSGDWTVAALELSWTFSRAVLPYSALYVTRATEMSGSVIRSHHTSYKSAALWQSNILFLTMAFRKESKKKKQKFFNCKYSQTYGQVTTAGQRNLVYCTSFAQMHHLLTFCHTWFIILPSFFFPNYLKVANLIPLYGA